MNIGFDIAKSLVIRTYVLDLEIGVRWMEWTRLFVVSNIKNAF